MVLTLNQDAVGIEQVILGIKEDWFKVLMILDIFIFPFELHVLDHGGWDVLQELQKVRVELRCSFHEAEYLTHVLL